jgi:hypothetical protein
MQGAHADGTLENQRLGEESSGARLDKNPEQVREPLNKLAFLRKASLRG